MNSIKPSDTIYAILGFVYYHIYYCHLVVITHIDSKIFKEKIFRLTMNFLKDKERKAEIVQRLAVKLFAEGLPAFIITDTESWINGYIENIDGLILTVIDRKHGKTMIPVTEIRILKQFVGDLSSLRKPNDILPYPKG